jgi:hypothetical protein
MQGLVWDTCIAPIHAINISSFHFLGDVVHPVRVRGLYLDHVSAEFALEPMLSDDITEFVE